MKQFERKIPGLIDAARSRRRAAEHRGLSRSERRIPFNEDGIFRHYKALDR